MSPEVLDAVRSTYVKTAELTARREMKKFIMERSAVLEGIQIQHMEKQHQLALKMAQNEYTSNLRQSRNHVAAEKRAVARYTKHMIEQTRLTDNLKKKYMAEAYKLGKAFYKQHVLELVRAYDQLRKVTATRR